MMIKIFKLSQQSVSLLESRLKENYETAKLKYSGEAALGFNLEEDNLEVLKGSYELPPHFILSEDTDGKKDYENAKILYSALEKLTPAEADDGRLWVYLTHFTFLDYTKKRWMRKEKKEEVIRKRFFYQGSSRKTRTQNAIARLWWTAHLTVRKNEPDENKKWELTKAIFSNQDLQTSLLERSMGSYENILHAFLELYIAKGSKWDKKTIQSLARDLNNSGGVYVLALYSKEEITQKLISFLNSYK